MIAAIYARKSTAQDGVAEDAKSVTRRATSMHASNDSMPLRHEHFKDRWWGDGTKNRKDFADLSRALMEQVKGRATQLRADAIADEGRA
jgi:hypothetical protein